MEVKHYACYFDGACEPRNPGGNMGLGAFVLNRAREYVFKHSEYITAASMNGKTSNNVAEYMALIAILNFLDKEKLHDQEIIICGDSMLAIEQMNLRWKINKGEYVPYAVKARTMARYFKNITFKWIPREKNKIADALSKKPMLENNCEFRIQKQ